MGRALFSAAQPIGCRCTCNYGKEHSPPPVNAWNLTLSNLVEEMKDFHSNALDPQLSEAEHRDAYARLRRLMQRAQQGVLEFSGASPDAKVMSRANFVIELRPQPERTHRFGRANHPARLVRLYCAEPNILDGTLLGLHLGTKPNDDDVQNEQDASIDIAAQRAHDWEMLQHVEKLTKTLGGGT